MSETIAGERSFIAKSWCESFASSAMAKLLTYAGSSPAVRSDEWHAGPSYWRTWNPLIDTLMTRARVTVAEDEGLIAGFLCWEPWGDGIAVHYVYTRLSYRGRGVARELLASLPSGPALYTHRSRGVRSVPESWHFSMAPLFNVSERKEAA